MFSNTLVSKFGGSSQCDKGYRTVKSHVESSIKEYSSVVIVVSAVGKTTNNLLKIINYQEDTRETIRSIHYELIESVGLDKSIIQKELGELDKLIKQLRECPSIDTTQQKIKIMSMGEIMSSVVLAKYLEKKGIGVQLLNARQFVKAKKCSSQIDPHNLRMKGEFYCDLKALEFLSDDSKSVYVTQGFIASTNDEKCCVLTRSGSDTSAAIIATGVNAKYLDIFTDVNGTYTADPRIVSDAKAICEIDYDICKEASIAGSQVLHPYCINPCRKKNISIRVRNTFDPDGSFTLVKSVVNTDPSAVHTIALKRNVFLFEIIDGDMWGDYGFVCDIFSVFKDNQVDVDIINTSHESVSTTTEEKSVEKIVRVQKQLESQGYTVKVTSSCAIVSIIAENVSTNPKLRTTTDIVNDVCDGLIYIKHYSSSCMNLSFVIDESYCEELVRRFHSEYISSTPTLTYHNDSLGLRDIPNMNSWWRTLEGMKLINRIAHNKETSTPLYIYNLDTIRDSVDRLKSMECVDTLYYAIKANTNLTIVETIYSKGIGLECVSIEEIRFVNDNIDREGHGFHAKTMRYDIIFTPNYCNINDYVEALETGALVIFDDWKLLKNPVIAKSFKDQCIGVRIDLDKGDGHHEKVVTEGDNVKFGLPLSELDAFIECAKDVGCYIVMVHSHKGSGIHNSSAWGDTYETLSIISKRIPDVTNINVGGGLGVFKNGKCLDLKQVNIHLSDKIDATEIEHLSNGAFRDFDVCMEPGRYCVAESGIIIARVNHIKTKNGNLFVGIDAGMNTLIRPMLYNSHHQIYNFTSHMDESNLKATDFMTCTVVGPICETGDILGKHIILPKSTKIGDIIVIENAGAYGYVMSSNYNLKSNPREIIFDPSKDIV